VPTRLHGRVVGRQASGRQGQAMYGARALWRTTISVAGDGHPAAGEDNKRRAAMCPPHFSCLSRTNDDNVDLNRNSIANEFECSSAIYVAMYLRVTVIHDLAIEWLS
jgi:hypothetical protein